MSTSKVQGKPPQDVVAIFHTSFHPTLGNVIDWSLKEDDSLDLNHVEFNCLPSGLHQIEEDVVYFTKDNRQGVCIFRRRQTAEQGHRGFRLSSLGILLAESTRPRPWKHVSALKTLVHTIYSPLEDREALEPIESDWDHARAFFEERRVRQVDLGGAGDWKGWDSELEGELATPKANPTLHLPHMLRILGPSSLTLYKHILGRRRILVYTLPPVEAACVFCQVAADLCYEDQLEETVLESTGRLKGKSKGGIKVLGMVTLNDLGRLEQESQTGRGWIACTTDAIFLEKPSYYDLLVDLTTTPARGSRPAFSAAKSIEQIGGRGPSHRLSSIHFSWSDVKLWAELDRLINTHSDGSCCSTVASAQYGKSKPGSATGWPDVWRVYEDVCVICAGLWAGTWRATSAGDVRTDDWQSVHLDAEDELQSRMTSPSRAYSRNFDMDSRPSGSQSTGEDGVLLNRTSKAMRRASGNSIWTWTNGRGAAEGSSSSRRFKDNSDEDTEDASVRREREAFATLALLQTFQNNTNVLLTRLGDILPQKCSHSHNLASSGSPVVLTPRDLLSLDLGPLSGLDGHFLEWIAEEYGGGVRVVVRRGWRDIVALIFGIS